MRFVRNIVLAFMMLTCLQAVSQEVTVSAKLDTAAMLIGDHVGMKLQFNGPARTQVLWPFIPDTILGNLTVIGRGKIDTVFSADKNRVTMTQEVNLTCFDSGFYTIPSIPFRYRQLPDTTSLVASSDLMMLMVHTVRVDTTQAIKPIIGPLKVPITLREMLPWIVGGLLLVAAIAAVIWYLRKRKKNEPLIRLRPAIVIPPHERALQEMEKLRLKKLWQAGRVKDYHSELTEILRIYIEDRFRVPALEQTTAEIIDGLIHQPELRRESLDKLGRILMLADMVKFAKVQPLAAENEKSLGEGIEFIQETRPTA